MSIFQDVVLVYDGSEYRVKARDVMTLIAKIEDVITIGELTSGNVKFAKLAMGYGEALRFAGATVEDAAVYKSIYTAKGVVSAQDAVGGLLALMIPSDIKPAKKKAAKKKKKST